ncbi:MAG: hypothetical protein ACK5WZ_02310, partial [Pseudobdellovibrionaceae bacterium]
MAWLTLFFLAWNVSAQNQAPQTFTIDGQLFDSSNYNAPLVGTGTLRFDILDSTKTCILYSEQQAFNTTATNGFFTAYVGSAVNHTKRTATYDPNNAMGLLFQNAVNVSGNLLSNPATPCTETATAGKMRYLQITVTKTAGTPEVLSPEMAINSVPSALSAQSVQGLERSEMLVRNAILNLTQGNLESLFTGTNFGDLTDLIAGNSTKYTQSSASEGTQLQVSTVGTPVTSPAAGSIWFDDITDTLKYSTGSATVTVGTSAGITSVGLAMPTMFNVTGSPLTANGTITATLSNQNANSVLAGPASGGAAAPTFRALGETDLPIISTAGKVSGSAITSGTIGGTTAMSTSGAIATSGNISSATQTLRQLNVYDSTDTNYVRLQTATGTSGNSHTLTLPATQGSNGQVLTNNGSGVLTWTSPSSGSVTSVTASAPLASSGGATPNISLTGTIPVASGGTNSTAALNNNRVMVSSGGAIVETSAITANRALSSNASGIPVASSVTDTELGYVSGVTSAIQTQINAKQASN